MGRALVFLLLLIAPVAHAQSTPRLSQAVQQYDAKDYESAASSLHAIVTDRSAPADERQRAELLMGRTLLSMGFPSAAMATFERIANEPAHRHREAVARWIAIIAESIHHPSADVAMKSLADLLDRAAFDAETAAAVAVLAGRDAMSTDRPAAIALFERVPKGSKWYALARHQLVIARLLERDIPAAAREVLEVDRDRAGVDAVIDLDDLGGKIEPDLVSVRGRRDDTLDKALASVSRGGSLRAAYAAIGLRRRELQVAQKLYGVGVDVRPFDALLLATACGRVPLDDFVRPALEVAREAATHIDELLAFEDNAEIHDAVQKFLRGRIDRPWKLYVRVVLDDPRTREAFLFEKALRAELALFKHTTPVWQTSPVASEILQELVVQSAVAQADLGRMFRNRLSLARGTLRNADEHLARSEKIEVRASPTPRGFVITDTICAAAIGKRVAQRPAAVTPAIPITEPARGRGCAGCASRSERDSSSVTVAFAIAIVVGRRRVYSKCRRSRGAR